MIVQRDSMVICLEYLIKLRCYLFVDQLINRQIEIIHPPLMFGLAIPLAVEPLDEPREFAPICTLKISLAR